MKNKLRENIHKVLSDKKLLSHLKLYWFTISLMIFGGAMIHIPSNNPTFYAISTALLLIILVVLNKLLDELYIKLILQDISKCNDETKRGLGSLMYQFNRMNEMQDDVIKDYARYYAYWEILKKSADQTKCDDLKNIISEVEKAVNPSIEKKF